jgi:hypothetical protein
VCCCHSRSISFEVEVGEVVIRKFVVAKRIYAYLNQLSPLNNSSGSLTRP